MPPQNVVSEPRRRRVSVRAIVGFVTFSLIAGLLGVVATLPAIGGIKTTADAAASLINSLPGNFTNSPMAQKSFIYAANGSVLAEFYAENRVVVPINEISTAMQHAVVSIEDKRFYEHGALDTQGLIRAMANNSLGNATQGASTITQQYVKNMLIEQALQSNNPADVAAARADTYTRKLREAKIAISVEHNMTKDQILAGYLNIAQFGPSEYGVETAANYYFGVHASQLNVVQAATIAAIANAPNAYDPTQHPQANTDRRNDVLRDMLNQGYISQAEYTKDVATSFDSIKHVSPPLPSGCQHADTVSHSGFFCDYVVNVIRNSSQFGKTAADRINLLNRGGLKITTPLNLDYQSAAWNALTAKVPPGSNGGLANSLVTVQPGTGLIQTMTENRQYSEATNPGPNATAINYNADLAYGGSRGFQAGSSFKPFVLANWLTVGNSLTDPVNGTLQDWSGQVFQAKGCTPGGQVKVESGYRIREPGGVMSPATALAQSNNAVFMAIEHDLDLCDIVNQAATYGVHRADGKPMEIVPTMVFGVNEISPLTEAAAYATFAADGKYCTPVAITKITDSTGRPMSVPSGGCRQALDANVARQVVQAMQGVLQRGGTAATSGIGRPAAGKTGTTENAYAVWFTGFTPQLVAAVWCGYPNALKEIANGTAFGATWSAPVWQQFMTAATANLPIEQFATPTAPVPTGSPTDTPSASASTGTQTPAPPAKPAPGPGQGGGSGGSGGGFQPIPVNPKP